jgi:hypothetical protein
VKLLFIQPPLGDGNTRMPLNQRLFPWGLATVARCLEEDGHEISALDVYARDLIKAEVESILDTASFDAACLTGFSSITYLYVLWLAEQIKKRYAVPVVAPPFPLSGCAEAGEAPTLLPGPCWVHRLP